MHLPRATYRLQFHENFRLTDALALVPYLHQLGISHLYSSPLFTAIPHSTHGYDVCDFNRLSPELGTEEDLKALVEALRQHEMGLVLDIVPNHMGIGTPHNSWWWDVLKNGKASAYAGHFDINWSLADAESRGKILLPVLGAEFEQILHNRELQIVAEGEGEMVLNYHEHKFPIAPGSVASEAPLKRINSEPLLLLEVLQQQNYRLMYYADPSGGLNYRRFFAINTLAGVRVEDPAVFENVHGRLQDWISKGLLDGVRVDHPDGLRDPEGYLRRLRKLAPDQWIVIEKILLPGESLPASWPVQGTSGYDFLNQVNGLFIDPAGEKPLTEFYRDFTGEPVDYPAIMREKKRLILDTLFPAEINRLVELLAARTTEPSSEWTRPVLDDGLKTVIACFPVYRSYLTPESDTGEEYIEQALAEAGNHRKDLPPALLAFLGEVLFHPGESEPERDFVAHFQQLTGAVMAKGVEDTAFYCYNRFLSLNEVGGQPGKFGDTVEAFHNFCRAQSKHWPHTMLASSTHDTKRSEDVRARLNLLSEIPDTWIKSVRTWSAMNHSLRQGEWPDRNAEYFLYQTMVGVWPGTPERILACIKKSVRESAQHTSWTKTNPAYESALENFVPRALANPEFIQNAQQFVDSLSEASHINSLSQTLLKLTAPGVPDIYQGNELWDFSLVDPDNRRPVDFGLSQQLLAKIEQLSPSEILARSNEGLSKMWLIRKVLALRADRREIFEGSYEPLFAQGEKAKHIIAYIRSGKAITIAPRLVLGLKDWAETFMELPLGQWQNLFTGEIVGGTVRLAKLLKAVPFALLVKKEGH